MNIDYTHSPEPGPSLIDRIQEALDHELGNGDPTRAEGIAKALGILRSSSTEHELELALARTGLEWDEDDEQA